MRSVQIVPGYKIPLFFIPVFPVFSTYSESVDHGIDLSLLASLAGSDHKKKTVLSILICYIVPLFGMFPSMQRFRTKEGSHISLSFRCFNLFPFLCGGKLKASYILHFPFGWGYHRKKNRSIFSEI